MGQASQNISHKDKRSTLSNVNSYDNERGDSKLDTDRGTNNSKTMLKNFTFLNYNVCGLAGKLSDHTFVNFVTTHDFVTFTETFIDEDFDASVFNEYDCFVSKAKKLSKQGRLSGGIVVLVKKHLSGFISHLVTDQDNVIVLRISKDLFCTDADVMFISTYIQPYDSVFWKHTDGGYGLEVIEECIISLHEKYDDFLILLTGDFNARTANNNYEDFEDDFEEVNTNISDNDGLYARCSNDVETNIFGHQLIELCKVLDCFIVNGIIKWKCDAGYTFVTQNGASVIDYFVMSCSMCSNCTDIKLNIKELVDSDHLPVQMTLSMLSRSQTIQFPNITNHSKIDKTVWDKEKESIFVDRLYDEDGLILLKEATDQLNVDVNKSLVLFTDYLLRAGECMKKRIFQAKSVRKSEWFDQECIQSKKECRRLLREYRKAKKSKNCICPDKRYVPEINNKNHTSCTCHEKREAFVENRKIYRKLLKQKRQQFRQVTAENLCKNMNAPSIFWNDLKKLGLRNKSRTNNCISIQEWFQHFQKLFRVDENNTDNAINTESSIEEDKDHVLNQVITSHEVEEAIKKIKCGKASGADGILGEMLKAGGGTVINFLTLLFNKIFDSGVYPAEWSKAIVVPIF